MVYLKVYMYICCLNAVILLLFYIFFNIYVLNGNFLC